MRKQLQTLSSIFWSSYFYFSGVSEALATQLPCHLISSHWKRNFCSCFEVTQLPLRFSNWKRMIWMSSWKANCLFFSSLSVYSATLALVPSIFLALKSSVTRNYKIALFLYAFVHSRNNGNDSKEVSSVWRKLESKMDLSRLLTWVFALSSYKPEWEYQAGSLNKQ